MGEERGNEGWEEEERQVSSPAGSRKRDAEKEGMVYMRFQIIFHQAPTVLIFHIIYLAYFALSINLVMKSNSVFLCSLAVIYLVQPLFQKNWDAV